jgi:hypothetical protein
MEVDARAGQVSEPEKLARRGLRRKRIHTLHP